MAYIFIAPYLLTAAIFTVGLLLYAFAISFTDLTASFAAANARFIGFDNYIRALSDSDFLTALGNAFWYFVIVTIVQTIGAILLAVALNAKMAGMRFFRTLLYSPSVASSIVMSLIFLWLYLPTGFINLVLGTDTPWLTTPDRIFAPFWNTIGLNSVPAFLQGPSVAWTSIMVLAIFTTIPTFMVMFLTALQDVPGYVYEAAAIDGATGVKAFWYITLPLLRPVITLVVILGTIGTFQVFDQVAILTRGGPLKTTLTPAFLIYQKTLGTGTQAEAGFAAAMAFILAFVIVAITLIQRRLIEQE
jgi:multiple sugar transport system permease protein